MDGTMTPDEKTEYLRNRWPFRDGKMMLSTCRTCYWWRSNDTADENVIGDDGRPLQLGTCLRYPPVAKADGRQRTDSLNPYTWSDHYCGEHTPRPDGLA